MWDQLGGRDLYILENAKMPASPLMSDLHLKLKNSNNSEDLSTSGYCIWSSAIQHGRKKATIRNEASCTENQECQNWTRFFRAHNATHLSLRRGKTCPDRLFIFWILDKYLADILWLCINHWETLPYFCHFKSLGDIFTSFLIVNTNFSMRFLTGDLIPNFSCLDF